MPGNVKNYTFFCYLNSYIHFGIEIVHLKQISPSHDKYFLIYSQIFRNFA